MTSSSKHENLIILCVKVKASIPFLSFHHYLLVYKIEIKQFKDNRLELTCKKFFLNCYKLSHTKCRDDEHCQKRKQLESFYNVEVYYLLLHVSLVVAGEKSFIRWFEFIVYSIYSIKYSLLLTRRIFLHINSFSVSIYLLMTYCC